MIRDYILVDKNQEEKTYKMIMKGLQSLKTNQKSRFKFKNQSNTDLKSSLEVIKAKLGIKRQSRPNPKNFTDTVAGQ
jgi:hypothetical protein